MKRIVMIALVAVVGVTSLIDVAEARHRRRRGGNCCQVSTGCGTGCATGGCNAGWQDPHGMQQQQGMQYQPGMQQQTYSNDPSARQNFAGPNGQPQAGTTFYRGQPQMAPNQGAAVDGNLQGRAAPQPLDRANQNQTND